MITGKQNTLLTLVLLLFLVLNVLTWFYARDIKGRWNGVPPIPDQTSINAFFLGDSQFAYRATGIMLQNLGETGGLSTAPDDYDYSALRGWFFLADALDPKSDFMPFLVSYYYGAAQNPENLRAVLDYLYVVGRRPGGEKWRWLAQGVYLARFKMGDMALALKFANTLASLDEPGLPEWTREMPAFVLNAKGSRAEALAMMMVLLKSNADKMNANELNFTRDYICRRLMEPAAAQTHPLCQNIP